MPALGVLGSLALFKLVLSRQDLYFTGGMLAVGIAVAVISTRSAKAS